VNSPILLLGIDGGGTRTRAVLTDARGEVQGQGESGGCNYHNVGADVALARMVEACNGAGWRGQQAAALFVGTAGVKAAADSSALEAARLKSPLAAVRSVFANDSENAHAAGLAGRPGVALIAGTGSIALGRSVDGRSSLSGGWGWLIDDAASGCWLGQQALHAVARAVDGRGPATALRASLLRVLGVEDPHTLLQRIYVGEFSAADFARLAPLILTAAREGDRVAHELLARGAALAAELVDAAASGAGLPPDAEIVLIGGIARSGPPYQPAIEAAIRARLPLARFAEPEFAPVIGAVIRAAQLARVPVSAEFLCTLRKSSARFSIHA
jgi:glucosamine kinase